MTHCEQVARTLGCTVAQVKAQFARNAAGLRTMADKARRSPKGLCNGYTAAELDAKVAQFDRYVDE